MHAWTVVIGLRHGDDCVHPPAWDAVVHQGSRRIVAYQHISERDLRPCSKPDTACSKLTVRASYAPTKYPLRHHNRWSLAEATLLSQAHAADLLLPAIRYFLANTRRRLLGTPVYGSHLAAWH